MANFRPPIHLLFSTWFLNKVSFQTDKFLSKHIIVEWREEQLTASWTVTTKALTAWKKIDVHLGEQ